MTTAWTESQIGFQVLKLQLNMNAFSLDGVGFVRQQYGPKHLNGPSLYVRNTNYPVSNVTGLRGDEEISP